MSAQAPPWLDVQKAAGRAAVSVTKIRRAIRGGGLRAYRIEGGRLLRLRAEDVDRWIEGGATEPRAPRPGGAR